MDRRTAIINLAMATGSITLLGRCNFGKERVAMALDHFSVTSRQQELMKGLVNAIIPEGEFKGASSLAVDHFVWVMADDCLTEDLRERFSRGLEEFEAAAGKENFLQASPAIQVELLTSWSGSESDQPDRDIHFFILTVKQLVIRGYMQSEYIMTEVMPYQLVPRSFSGCAPVNEYKRINVNG